MTIHLAVVGPGRVGSALGRQWVRGGIELMGFVGRDPARTEAAVRFCGAGRVLSVADLSHAHVVVLAVWDPDLPNAVAACAAAPPRPCSLWLHTSGRHDLDVLDPLVAHGARRGILHPAVPVPDPLSGLRNLEHGPAVLTGDENAMQLLRRLAESLGMVAVPCATGRRSLYHAACALAANGATALFGAVERVLAAHGGIDPDDRRMLVAALAERAISSCRRDGPAPSLSGPVVRGDHQTVAAHLDALRAAGDAPVGAYVALMREALRLARMRGLDAVQAARLEALLGGEAAR